MLIRLLAQDVHLYDNTYIELPTSVSSNVDPIIPTRIISSAYLNKGGQDTVSIKTECCICPFVEVVLEVLIKAPRASAWFSTLLRSAEIIQVCMYAYCINDLFVYASNIVHVYTLLFLRYIILICIICIHA